MREYIRKVSVKDSSFHLNGVNEGQSVSNRFECTAHKLQVKPSTRQPSRKVGKERTANAAYLLVGKHTSAEQSQGNEQKCHGNNAHNCKKDILAVQNDKTDYKLISPEEQRAMRKMIYQAVQTWENHPVEKYITKYRGFEICVPAYMVPKPPKNVRYITLKGNGVYYLEIKSESGITTRLNHFIASYERYIEGSKTEKEEVSSGLENCLLNYQGQLEELQNKLKQYAETLSKNEDFLGEIRKVKQQLLQIDSELGLSKED